MRLGADHVRVTVPATSANLGPGYDSLGLALDLRDEIEVRALASSDVVVEVVGEGADEVPRGADHLVAQAVRLGLDHVGAPEVGLRLRCHNRVPHGRGLGSSAAAVVGGLLAARGLIGEPELLDDDTLLALATRVEGHPDNAAPAILGGLTVAWSATTEDDAPGAARAARLDVGEQIEPVVLVPQERLATHVAREALPATVPHADAAFNAARAALLVAALAGRPDLLLEATADRLHQDYRAPSMRPSADLVTALRAQGLAAVVSGAGPTVLVLAEHATRTQDDPRVAQALEQVAAADASTGWRVVRPGIAAHGGTVERLG